MVRGMPDDSAFMRIIRKPYEDAEDTRRQQREALSGALG